MDKSNKDLAAVDTILAANLHKGEMVLPPDILHGLLRLTHDQDIASVSQIFAADIRLYG